MAKDPKALRDEAYAKHADLERQVRALNADDIFDELIKSARFVLDVGTDETAMAALTKATEAAEHWWQLRIEHLNAREEYQRASSRYHRSRETKVR